MTIRYAIAFRVWSRRRILGGYRSAPRTSSRARSAGHRWRRFPASTDEPRAGIALDLATAQNYAPDSRRRSRSERRRVPSSPKRRFGRRARLSAGSPDPALAPGWRGRSPVGAGTGDIVLAVIRASGVAEGAD